MTQKKQTIDEQIKNVKVQIASNSKDAEWAKKMLNQLFVLQKQSMTEPTELSVPCKEVKASIDLGACKISRTIRGYLFEAKGGLYTFVDLRMGRVCAMLNTLFELHAKDEKSEDEQTVYSTFVNAVEYVFQAPIFASMNETSLFSIATSILHVFNEYCNENFTNAEAPERTEEDYKADVEFEQFEQAAEVLVNAPIPPEE